MTNAASTTNCAIDLKVYTGEFLLNLSRINRIQRMLHSLAPHWSSRVTVVDSDAPSRFADLRTPKSLYQLIVEDVQAQDRRDRAIGGRLEQPSNPRVCDTIELEGASPALTVIISVDEQVLQAIGDIRTFGNYVSIQVRSNRVAEVDAIDWTGKCFRELCRAVGAWYGHAELRDEFQHKNISTANGRIEAVGVDMSKALPGLYWLNYFGRPYVRLIGEKTFERCGAARVERLGAGILVMLEQEPHLWNTQQYRSRSRQVELVLGEQHFYLKDAPARKTVAPDFTVETA